MNTIEIAHIIGTIAKANAEIAIGMTRLRSIAPWNLLWLGASGMPLDPGRACEREHGGVGT